MENPFPMALPPTTPAIDIASPEPAA